MIYHKGHVLMRSLIIDYTDKTRCVSVVGLDMDNGNVLVWQHEYTDDEGEGITDTGFRSLKAGHIVFLDDGSDLAVHVSALCHSRPRKGA